MNTRIRKIRRDNGLTQDAFAKRLSLSRNYISLMEKGDRIPSDRTISDICREFNINEEWMKTGHGEIYNLPEDETAAIVSELLEDDNPLYDIIKGIMKTYQQLDIKSQNLLQDFSKELLNNLKKED